MEGQDLTVAIPVYNRARMLAQALESCRRQTLRGFSVLVWDNCSTEDLSAVVSQFPDLRISYRRHDAPVSAVANFVAASEAVETSFVKFLCSDDLLFPRALEWQLGALLRAPAAAICLGGFVEFSESDGSATPRLHQFRRPSLPVHDRLSGWLRFETVNCYFPSASLYRARCFHEVGGFHSALTAAMDWENYLALLARYEVVKVDETVCANRRHAEQWTCEAAFESGARFLRDVLLLTSARTNPLLDRMGLPATQLTYLRHQSCWAALRQALSARGGQARGVRQWWRHMAGAGMGWPLAAGVLPWLAAKTWEKLNRRLHRESSPAPAWPGAAARAETTANLQQILDGGSAVLV